MGMYGSVGLPIELHTMLLRWTVVDRSYVGFGLLIGGPPVSLDTTCVGCLQPPHRVSPPEVS